MTDPKCSGPFEPRAICPVHKQNKDTSDPTGIARRIADWFLPPSLNVTEDPNSLLRIEIATALREYGDELKADRDRWADSAVRLEKALEKADAEGFKKGFDEGEKTGQNRGYRRGVEESAKAMEEKCQVEYCMAEGCWHAEYIRERGTGGGE